MEAQAFNPASFFEDKPPPSWSSPEWKWGSADGVAHTEAEKARTEFGKQFRRSPPVSHLRLQPYCTGCNPVCSGRNPVYIQVIAALVGEARLSRLRGAQDGARAQVPARQKRRVRRSRRPVGGAGAPTLALTLTLILTLTLTLTTDPDH